MLPGPIEHFEGPKADLQRRHATVGPASRFGLFLINTTGGPDNFTIGGGPGRPGDVPGGMFCAVSMIHSFSAADPADPQTIAGRWLGRTAPYPDLRVGRSAVPPRVSTARARDRVDRGGCSARCRSAAERA